MSLLNYLMLVKRFKSSNFFDLNIGGVKVQNVAPLGNLLTPGITKAGRLSFSGYVGSRKVKIYSAFSVDQIALRVDISNFGFEKFCFPEVVAHDEFFIVEEWINGCVLNDKESGKVISNIINELHEAKTNFDGCESGFCYLQDYLLERLSRWLIVPEIRIFADRWSELYEEKAHLLEKKIFHPDLNRRNIVVCSQSKKPYVIDNELFGFGRGWIIDHRNAGLDRSQDLSCFDADLVKFSDITWCLRRLGSLMDSCYYSEAVALIRASGCLYE